MKILVTGFDPFGKDSINPSIEAVKLLANEIAGATIIKLEIPTVCHTSLQRIDKAIKQYNPDVILSIGQAGGRSEISVERLGINLDDCRIPDNDGNQYIDQPIFMDGPAAYFVNLPIKAMVREIRKQGIPAAISNSAGTFVCNHVTYGVRHIIESKYPGKISGFIHVPYLPSQVIQSSHVPSMDLSLIVKGISAAIQAIVENQEDIQVSEGSIC